MKNTVIEEVEHNHSSTPTFNTMLKKSKFKRALKENIICTLFIFPAIAIYTFFYTSSVVKSLYLSFVKWNGIPAIDKKFVGLRNFINIFKDPSFYSALKNVGGFYADKFCCNNAICISFITVS